MSLILVQSLLKGQKMDLIVEKTTELGVDCITPVVSAFTVAQLSHERQSERLARWQRIAQSAAKQSGNPVPQILPPRPLRVLLDAIPQETGKILLYEREQNLTLKTFAQTHPTFFSLHVVVGPEGGFAEGEIEHARHAGFQIVGLGTQILRAETASLAAVVLCRFLWGGIELPPLL
jgi:16S rRNA (uracil1498-N3)-methyltransferase